MLHVEDVPPTVAINESLEIAKRYAEPDSVGFINGILDGMQLKDTT
jgi:N utilization substance protein B